MVLDALKPGAVLLPHGAAQVLVEQAGEDIVRHRREDAVVALRAGPLERGRVVAAAKGVRGAEGDLEAAAAGAREPRGGAVDEDAPAPRLDLRAQALQQRLPAAARVAEHLPAHLAAAGLPAQGQLLPEPGHRDLPGAVAELAAEQRPPYLLPGLGPHLPHDPRLRGLPLEVALLPPAPLQPQRREAHAQARAQAHRAETQQVERRGEGVAAALREDGNAGGQPFDRILHAQLAIESRDVDVAGEEVVVVALEQVAAADVERGDLAAEAGPALVDVDLVPLLRQPVAGDEAGHTGPQNRDPHRGCGSAERPSSGSGSAATMLTRSRTT